MKKVILLTALFPLMVWATGKTAKPGSLVPANKVKQGVGNAFRNSSTNPVAQGIAANVEGCGVACEGNVASVYESGSAETQGFLKRVGALKGKTAEVFKTCVDKVRYVFAGGHEKLGRALLNAAKQSGGWQDEAAQSNVVKFTEQTAQTGSPVAAAISVFGLTASEAAERVTEIETACNPGAVATAPMAVPAG